MNQILVELVKLANLVVTLTRAMASVGRIRTVMDTETSMKFPEVSSASWTPSEDAVVFSHVDMRYASSGGESLTDISFRVRTGETVGIIGSTGSGKTTLVQLIPRFYDASAGTVTLMGQPISSWSREDLRRHIAIVMQRPQLFSGTIRENVTWGRPDASDEEIWQALDMAQATDMVRGKKNGLDEMLEQGGRNLSGGQKQRLTIARALIARPDILILDDSSSALDYATDAALRRALRELKNTTLFIVSQRTSSIRHCHHILVLDEGHLVGDATHEELLASCPVYREIHESQFQKGDARA